MNMHNLTFPVVAKYHEPGNHCGTTFIMYNPTSAIVIEVESESPYTVGQILEERIGFRDTEYVTFEKMPFQITKYCQALEKLVKQRKRELEVMEFILRGCEDDK